VVVGEAGLLLRGPSGSGKSQLARRLIDAAAARGRFARLVADDRVLVRISGGRALARPHPALKGYVEVRGIGILPMLPEPACVLALVVDLEPGPGERMPDPGLMRSRSLGIDLPRIAAGPGDADRVLLALSLIEHGGGFQEPPGEVERSWGLHLSPHRTK
jgi:hypothetical protein